MMTTPVVDPPSPRGERILKWLLQQLVSGVIALLLLTIVVLTGLVQKIEPLFGGPKVDCSFALIDSLAYAFVEYRAGRPLTDAPSDRRLFSPSTDMVRGEWRYEVGWVNRGTKAAKDVNVVVRATGDGVLRFSHVRQPEPLVPVRLDTANGRLTLTQDALHGGDQVAVSFSYSKDAPGGSRKVYRQGEVLVDLTYGNDHLTCKGGPR